MRLLTGCRLILAALLALPFAAFSAPSADPLAIADWLQAEQRATPLMPTHPNPFSYGKPWLLIGVKSQTLTYYDEYGLPERQYLVSTAKLGVGEQKNSYQTPRGWHRICEKIGDGAEKNTIIFRQAVTPWKYTEALHQQYPNKDWILTRILWLCGMEPGLNRGGDVDSYERFIYIHGAGAHVPFGTPSSLGCVRMKSDDVIELFDHSPIGTDVYIDENT